MRGPATEMQHTHQTEYNYNGNFEFKSRNTKIGQMKRMVGVDNASLDLERLRQDSIVGGRPNVGFAQPLEGSTQVGDEFRESRMPEHAAIHTTGARILQIVPVTQEGEGLDNFPTSCNGL